MKSPRLAVFAAVLALAQPALAGPKPHNVLIFVADGLRYVSVTAKTAPTLWRIKSQGVDFTNSHALYPTITTVNASAIATGHYIGDTGDFGNTIYSGFNSAATGNSPIAAFEDDTMLGEMNTHFGGNYLNETSLIAAAREAGFATAVMGKVGPTAIQDVTQRDGTGTIVIDDAYNTPKGIAVAPGVLDAIKAAGIASTAPKTAYPNNDQQQYTIAVATKVVLPKLAGSGKPFAMLYWSRDPDATQHSAKDSLGKLDPGINSPSGRAAIKDADDTLAALLAWLKANNLDKTTDIFVTADHGFSTIEKHSATSAAARYEANDDNPLRAVDTKNAPPPADKRDLPPGFLAIDLADALGLPLTDPHLHKDVDYKHAHHPGYGDGFIGKDPEHPDVMVIENGGSDHIYLPGLDAKARAAQIVDLLTKEDYVSGIFVDDALGDIAGSLPMSAINLRGTALTPQPAIVVSFASHLIAGCKPELMCAAEVADTSLATGQGMHGTFSRADTRNFMAAIGPDFKARFADKAPVSNADINPTLAKVLGLAIPAKGGLRGRTIGEALTGGKPVGAAHGRQVSAPAANGQKTVLEYQRVGDTRYFDAAGFPGRTVGLAGR
ncbi:MAG TPA: alkaline phosphatase family protein [Rhizomicrobium sp.]|nr:alkaline phosphatase family protein [Rhizomicrobium sp.]